MKEREREMLIYCTACRNYSKSEISSCGSFSYLSYYSMTNGGDNVNYFTKETRDLLSFIMIFEMLFSIFFKHITCNTNMHNIFKIYVYIAGFLLYIYVLQFFNFLY